MIVSALAVSHAPFIASAPDRPDADQAKRFYTGYDNAAQRLREADPDVILLVTAEHFTNFLSVVPAFHIHAGDQAFGPIEAGLGIEQRHVPNAPDVARELLSGALDDGIDLSFGHHLELDHGSMVPLHFLDVDPETPVVPLIVNCLVEPMPSFARCVALGRSLHRRLGRMQSRVALVAAGGLSHWPGMPEAGRISETWDRDILQQLDDDIDVLRDPPDDPDRGPGAEELRAWTIVAEAAGAVGGDVLAYEAVAEWSTGCAVVEFRLPVAPTATAGGL